MNLYFRPRSGYKRFMKGGVREDNALKRIYEAVEDLNPNYQIPYIRHWVEDGIHWYDVGSHTEFFTLEDD